MTPDYDKIAAQFGGSADLAQVPDKYELAARKFGGSTDATATKAAQKGNAFVDGAIDLAAGAGTEFGKLVLGGQRFLGKGLSAVGADSAGQWLVEDADAGKRRLDAENAQYKDRSPIANGVGGVGGSIVATLPVGGLLPAALRTAAGAKGVVGVLPRAAQAAGIGAAYGALTGTASSNADTLGGMLTDGASGAGSGAIFGGVSSPVAAGIAAVARNGAQRLSSSSAAAFAKQKVAEALARDARGKLATGGYINPLGQVAARFNKLGDEAVLADAGGRNTNQLLDTLAILPGRTKEAAYNMLRQRTAGVGDRMRQSADDALGTQGQRLDETVENLFKRRQQDSAPLYAQLRQIDIAPSQNLEEIVQAADKLGVTKLGREIATARQMPFTLDAAKPAQWNMGDLDHVKQGLDQVLSSRKALNADGKLTPLGESYQALKNALVGELDQVTMNPQTGASLYREARQAFATPSGLIDAARAGRMAIDRDESSILSAMRGMSGVEQEAFRIGAFEGLRGKLGTQGGQTNIMNMWKEPATQEKLKAVFGNERSYREFAADVAREATLKRLQSVGAGSQTAARQAGMGDLDLAALSDAGAALGAAKTGNLLSAVGSAKNAWNRVAVPQTVRDQMGSMLLSRGAAGQQNLQSLDALIQQINMRNLLLSNSVGVLGAGAGTSLARPPIPLTQYPEK
jgi:hypothetical protein